MTLKNTYHNGINRIREMVSFEFGEEIEKDVSRLVTSVRLRKILSPYNESKLRPSDSALRSSTTELQRLSGERGL